jgi:hypothetical protein
VTIIIIIIIIIIIKIIIMRIISETFSRDPSSILQHGIAEGHHSWGQPIS